MATWCVIGVAVPASARTAWTTPSRTATKSPSWSRRSAARRSRLRSFWLSRWGCDGPAAHPSRPTPGRAARGQLHRAAGAGGRRAACSQQYRSELVRNARVVWGMDAPVSTFAAQIHQESAWRPGAVSAVGAQGMAQFMPATSSWIAGLYPALAQNAPFNPSWALRALVTYDRYLYDRIRARDDCERMAMTLSAYNGGLGWISRDQKRASSSGLDPLIWWGSVETVNAGRSAANWRENRAYPDRIIHHHQPTYVAASWGLAYARESEHRGLGDRARRTRRRPGLLARRGQWARAWCSQDPGCARRPPGRVACQGLDALRADVVGSTAMNRNCARQ